MAAWHHKTYKSRFPIDIIAPQNYKIKPLEKKFTLLIQIKLKTENHIMDININFKNGKNISRLLNTRNYLTFFVE